MLHDCFLFSCSYVISDCLCPKFQVSLTAAHLPQKAHQPVLNVVQSRQRNFSGVAGATTGMGQLSIGRGRGRGVVRPESVRQPKIHHGIGRGGVCT